jgi:probable HAF family extracellular repeat protein
VGAGAGVGGGWDLRATLAEVRAINERGQIIVQSNTVRAFVWENGRLTNLGTLGGNEISAIAINESGQVIGLSQVAGSSQQHPFLWQRGRMVELATLSGRFDEVLQINDNGQIIGSSKTRTGSQPPVVWEDGEITKLGGLAGQGAHAVAINNRGQIVGTSATKTGRTRFDHRCECEPLRVFSFVRGRSIERRRPPRPGPNDGT